MDVKNVFLNGELTEKVYMQPIPKYSHPFHKIYKLRRAFMVSNRLFVLGSLSVALQFNNLVFTLILTTPHYLSDVQNMVVFFYYCIWMA